jgi:predicted enzyme related to lactoylglutathione lyase
MVVADVVGAVEFLRTVFGATGEVHPDRPAEVRIGDSMVMVSGAGERELFPALLYMYVDGADSVYRHACAAGAVVVEEPMNTPVRRQASDGPRSVRERVPDRASPAASELADELVVSAVLPELVASRPSDRSSAQGTGCAAS